LKRAVALQLHFTRKTPAQMTGSCRGAGSGIPWSMSGFRSW